MIRTVLPLVRSDGEDAFVRVRAALVLERVRQRARRSRQTGRQPGERCHGSEHRVADHAGVYTGSFPAHHPGGTAHAQRDTEALRWFDTEFREGRAPTRLVQTDGSAGYRYYAPVTPSP